MRYINNISNASSATLNARPRVNHATGTPQTVGNPDEFGIGITKSIFGWKYLSVGGSAPNGGAAGGNSQANAYIDQYGLPFIFVVNGQQILLPPVVKAGGTPVPQLPDGLTVQYAPSFMGVPIPHDLFRPICIGGKLTFDRTEMPSAQNAYSSMTSRAAGSWSNAVLLNNGVDNGVNKGETLLYIVMSVFECLIYSYSSYPWGNNYNDLAGQVMTHRNYGNWLSYPLQTNTLLGNVVKQAAPIFVNTIGPAINTVLPGVGTAISGVISKGAQSESANQQPQLINPAETTQLAPGGVGSSGGMSPIIIVAIVAIGLFILLRK